MKVADLYIRVSTDEQADKGYSQRNQEEMLRRYCEINSITVRKVVFEDHSAKTFNRPQWITLLTELKKRKGQSDLILFTKWDRFSRNAGDAYQMISMLRKLGVEPQAIEQPLDLSIPENKMMLAFYLAAPEVENDRRALNTFFGMRRAKKEGRWMATAPLGYLNKVRENGRKYIAPDELKSNLIKWIFETVAMGTFTTEQIWKQALQKGFKCSKHGFWIIIRNPVYCGKIFVPKYKDEESHFVQGQHEPLISESLFYQVQDVLDGKKKYHRTKIMVDEMLPLRGFLICPRCSKLLTGSASRGSSRKYYYYHCTSTCGCRFSVTKTNELFISELKKYTPRAEMIELYKLIFSEEFSNQSKNRYERHRQTNEQIKELNNNLSKARNLLITDAIDASDYRIIKNETEDKIRKLEASISASSIEEFDVNQLLNKALDSFSNLDQLYVQSDIIRKREIISSIFPEKLTFDGFNYRTTRLNEAVQLIYKLDKGFREKNKGQSENFLAMSLKVTPQGLEPWTY